MASRMASAFHSSTQIGMQIRIGQPQPWRTVRRISRTECGLRPRSAAIIGEVAYIRPRPKISGMK